MTNDAYDDPTDAVGDLGNGPDDAATARIEEAEANTDLMRADEDPLPDAQVPGVGPDGQAPNTPA
jgi:hypothetical protein